MTDRPLILGLIVASVLAFVAAGFLGSTSIAPERLLAALVGAGAEGDRIILWQIRLPRALAAYLTGAALGASGAALQGLLRNPLAEPGVLGISAISTLAATLTLYYGASIAFGPLLPLAAIAGAVGATFLLTLIAERVGSVVTLILIGIGLTSLAGALMALLLNLAPNPFTLADMINWTMGSVANRGLNDILLGGPFLLAGWLLLFLTRRNLSVLTLGEDAAHGLGLNLSAARRWIVIGTGLATGASISIAGTVGFVGIVAPHIVRPWVDHDPARTILPASLLSGLFLLLADIAVRLIPTPNELKLGVMAALVGAPVFIWIASQRGRHVKA